MTFRYARTSPGFTWVRCHPVDAGIRCHISPTISYYWRRSPWRIAWAWVATAAVFAFLAWGVGG